MGREGVTRCSAVSQVENMQLAICPSSHQCRAIVQKTHGEERAGQLSLGQRSSKRKESCITTYRQEVYRYSVCVRACVCVC